MYIKLLLPLVFSFTLGSSDFKKLNNIVLGFDEFIDQTLADGYLKSKNVKIGAVENYEMRGQSYWGGVIFILNLEAINSCISKDQSRTVKDILDSRSGESLINMYFSDLGCLEAIAYEATEDEEDQFYSHQRYGKVGR